jgi:acyl-CoA reductase-like NAD-dependent aldehyde dehydrogenase
VDLSLSIRAGNVGPFGGFKMSGLGRACSIEGIEAFLETKRISIGI